MLKTENYRKCNTIKDTLIAVISTVSFNILMSICCISENQTK